MQSQGAMSLPMGADLCVQNTQHALRMTFQMWVEVAGAD